MEFKVGDRVYTCVMTLSTAGVYETIPPRKYIQCFGGKHRSEECNIYHVILQVEKVIQYDGAIAYFVSTDRHRGTFNATYWVRHLHFDEVLKQPRLELIDYE